MDKWDSCQKSASTITVVNYQFSTEERNDSGPSDQSEATSQERAQEGDKRPDFDGPTLVPNRTNSPATTEY